MSGRLVFIPFIKIARCRVIHMPHPPFLIFLSAAVFVHVCTSGVKSHKIVITSLKIRFSPSSCWHQAPQVIMVIRLCSVRRERPADFKATLKTKLYVSSIPPFMYPCEFALVGRNTKKSPLYNTRHVNIQLQSFKNVMLMHHQRNFRNPLAVR